MEARQEEKAFVQSSAEYEKVCGTLTPRTSSVRSATPPWDSPRQSSSPPSTIILGLWPGARSEQIDYYVQGYSSVYPTSNVMLLHRTSTQFLDSALQTLTGDGEKTTSQRHQDILIHLFGDDAASRVCRLLRAYRLRTEQTLGVKAIILDSVPVVVAPSLSNLQSQPWRMFPFLYLTMTALLWRLISVLTLWFSEPFGPQVRKDLHNPNLVPVDARKCYIFPEKDIMFVWDESGDESERLEFGVKRGKVDQRERWTGDQERYWLGIEGAWEGR